MAVELTGVAPVWYDSGMSESVAHTPRVRRRNCSTCATRTEEFAILDSGTIVCRSCWRAMVSGAKDPPVFPPDAPPIDYERYL